MAAMLHCGGEGEGEEAGGGVFCGCICTHMYPSVFASPVLITDRKVTRGPLCSSTQG